MQKKLLMTASSYEHIREFHLPYLQEFKKLGWVVHIAGANMPDSVPFTDLAINQPFNKHEGIPENLKTVSFLRKLIDREKYDLIITHTTLGAFITRLAVMGKRRRSKLIYMCHGYLFSEDMPRKKNFLLMSAERLTAGVTDLLLTMNRYDYEAAKKYRYGKRIENVPGIGVDFHSFDLANTGERERLRRNYGISDEDVVLIYAAEFSGRKSQAYLIDAMAYLPENVVLALPGTGKMFDECSGHAKRCGHRILLPGYVDDISSWYEMADIAVSSSRTEGLPFNILEAMYMGLPVAASAVKGHVDLIEHDQTGLLFPYGQSQECAEQIRRLIEDPELRVRLAENAKKTLDQYSLDVVLPQVMEYYKSLM